MLVEPIAFLALACSVGWLGGVAFRNAANRRDCRREGHVWKKVRPGAERCVRCPARRLVGEPPCERCAHDRFNHVDIGLRDECAVVGCPCANYRPEP